MIGRRLGNFELVELLGRGGMGEVYGARHVRLGHEAAIKVLRPELCDQREILERFYIEAKAAAALQHPGIIQVHDFDQVDGAAFIVMERLVGESLRTQLDRVGRLELERGIEILCELAEIMTVAHDKGIVHRDLKPDNIFLVKDPARELERVKVLDFGIAKIMDADGPTRAGVILGTPHYLSPEQCASGTDVGPHSDQYALGCMTFEMLTGRPPFKDAASLPQLIGAHLYAEPPTLAAAGATVPPHIELAVRIALAKSPADRHANVLAFASALAEPAPAVAKTATLTTPIDAAVPEATSRRALAIWLALGVAGIAIASIVVFRSLRSSEAGSSTPDEPRIARMWQPTHQACRDGEAAACTRLAHAFNGVDLANDPVAKLRYAELACTGHDGEGCAIRGLAYRNGEGSAYDRGLAIASFERSCSLGFGNGCSLLGREHAAEPKRALDEYRRGCALRHSASCGNVGAALLEQGGNPIEAREALRHACDAGVAEACMRLSKLFETGSGEVKVDEWESRSYRRRACSLAPELCR